MTYQNLSNWSNLSNLTLKSVHSMKNNDSNFILFPPKQQVLRWSRWERQHKGLMTLSRYIFRHRFLCVFCPVFDALSNGIKVFNICQLWFLGVFLGPFWTRFLPFSVADEITTLHVTSYPWYMHDNEMETKIATLSNMGTLSAFIYHPNTSQSITAQKMKFSIKDFFSKCDQIRRNLPVHVAECRCLKIRDLVSFLICSTILVLKWWQISRI